MTIWLPEFKSDTSITLAYYIFI